MAEIVVRKAVVADGDRILRLVNELATQQIMLPRAPASVIEHIRDFAIVTSDGAFAGCGALQIAWSDLAEVRSLAIDPTIQQKGLGRALVARGVISEAQLEAALALQRGSAERGQPTRLAEIFVRNDLLDPATVRAVAAGSEPRPESGRSRVAWWPTWMLSAIGSGSPTTSTPRIR